MGDWACGHTPEGLGSWRNGLASDKGEVRSIALFWTCLLGVRVEMECGVFDGSTGESLAEAPPDIPDKQVGGGSCGRRSQAGNPRKVATVGHLHQGQGDSLARVPWK